MSESFAGITVPSGSVGELRCSASRLGRQASVLADASQRLSGMPSAASSWIGPAHSAYTPQQSPAARPITSADVHLGLGAGAGAAAATPGAQP